MGHSYGGGSIVQASSVLGERQLKALVALDPWLDPVNKHVIQHALKMPIICIENEYFTKDRWISGPNDAFAKVNNPSNILRINLKKADHLHQCDLSFILGSLLNIVKHSEKSYDWLLVNVGIV